MIEQLPPLEPDSTRLARTLAQCHAQIDRRRDQDRAAARYTLERSVLLGFGALYLSSMAINMIQILTGR